MTIRNQIADILRYLRKTGEYNYERPLKQVVIGELYAAYGVSVSEILSMVDPTTALDSVFLSSFSSEDYDGYTEDVIALYRMVKMSDNEYFEYLSDIICPNGFQQEQYQTYLRLKAFYERE